MNFDELYKKYKDNTATDEERAYVEAEIEKAKSISRILDNGDEASVKEKVIKLADADIVKKAKKAFNKKSTIKTVIIVCICVFLIGALAVGGVAAVVLVSANKSKSVSESEAVNIAKEYLAECESIENIDDIKLIDKDIDVEISHHLGKSRYVYEIELGYAGCEYEVVVHGDSGFPRITDYDGYFRKNETNQTTAELDDNMSEGDRYSDTAVYYDDDIYDDYDDDDIYDDRCNVCYEDESKRSEVCNDCCVNGYCKEICPFD